MSPSGLQTLVMEVLGEGAPPQDQVETIIKTIVGYSSGNINLFKSLNAMSDKMFIISIKHSHKQVFRVSEEDTNDRLREALGSFDRGRNIPCGLKVVFEVFDKDDSG